MVVKQVFVNVFEYFSERILIGRKIGQVDRLFAEPIKQAALVGDVIEEADLKMHCEIEKQLCMAPPPTTLVFYYNEGII